MTTRTYYPGVPDYIQTSQRFFIETNVCEIFATMMNCVWYVSVITHLKKLLLNVHAIRTSATNCANSSFAPEYIKTLLPPDWRSKLYLHHDDVWDSFFIHGLLIDHAARSTVLQVPNQTKTQADRLFPALEAQTLRMMGTGQAGWNHACEVCTHVSQGENGDMRMLIINVF